MAIDYVVHTPCYAHTPLGTVVMFQNTLHFADIMPVSLDELAVNQTMMLRQKHGIAVTFVFTGSRETSHVVVSQPERETLSVKFTPLNIPVTPFEPPKHE